MKSPLIYLFHVAAGNLILCRLPETFNQLINSSNGRESPNVTMIFDAIMILNFRHITSGIFLLSCYRFYSFFRADHTYTFCFDYNHNPYLLLNQAVWPITITLIYNKSSLYSI